MVKFIPPYLGQEIKSNAEKKIYEVLQGLRLNQAYVFHSLGLPRHESKIYGEIDFVVLCERGVACLEIKGGRVACREGVWCFTDRYGVEREKTEGPFAQVTGNMFSLRKILNERFAQYSQKDSILVACGVMFPDIEFTSKAQEIIPEIIYDRRTDDITRYIEQVFDYWQERRHREPVKLSSHDMKEIAQYLRGEFCFIPALGSRLENTEQNLIRLTLEQTQLMDALSENDHLLIEGGAGTGKTLLAVDFAKKQVQKGRKVLFLTYNKNLANQISERTEADERFKIINIHALFGEYVTVAPGDVEKNPQKYFSEILPELFANYISALPAGEREQIQYDLLVMDEGQDMLCPAYLYPLEYLLKGGFENGHWAVFYDEKQNIYNPEFQDGMELIQSYASTRFKLFVNCRNTVQIGTYTFDQCGLGKQEYIRENGEEVQTITYTGTEDFTAQTRKLLKYLRKEKVRMQDVVFLSVKKYENSLLAKAGVEVREIGQSGVDGETDIPGYATIQGFKGLDAKVIVLFGVEDIHEGAFQKYMYIAGTRARTLLYVMRAGNTKEE